MERRRWWIAPSILGIALILALAWGYNEYRTKNELGVALENNYQRLFFDVKKHIENVQVNLSKAMLSNSRDQNVLLLSQIMNEAYFAQDKLSQMPITHAETAATEKFLNQAADYSYHLIQTHLAGKPITNEQMAALANLQQNSSAFNEELAKLQSELADKDFLFSSLNARQNKKIREGNQKIFQTTLVNIEKNMAETPELIYDGPFSDQMLNRKPQGLDNRNVPQEEAQRIARDFFGVNRVKDIDAFEEGKHASEVRIPSYTFNLYPKNASRELPVYMGVSKRGGHVIWMTNPRPVNSNTKISIEEAQRRALNYLEQKGFENMEPNYYQKYDGGVLFNFVNTEQNVTIYPDLIKVKVALDNGEIIGFDASAYYMNHQNRDIEEPELTLEEAREKVRTDFEINSSRLAIIPKGKNEILCYEFKGNYRGSDYIVYINALTGNEEQILQIIKDENGTLTF
ncbi:germination protein YpeB [Tepidimicrobium xylanilyticum]|uniref:Spore germination protein n=1 Tax=Tepidimicrobium xylanilyticum TaxID=1123352 RepID=A0A1H2WDH9_9FIRM|nr:germination protein YpeB [Tepidimicrobium xylanilyticum]SDW78743.1 spore germination protein [Tepidimicrobium xylanilyticum]